MNFDTYSINLNQLSVNLGEAAASASDRKAGDHVLIARANYTAVAFAVMEMMNTTRDQILVSIHSRKDVLAAKIPEVEVVADDLEGILRARKCSAKSINTYFTLLFGGIFENLQTTISQAGESHMQLIQRQFVPIYLIEDLFVKLNFCLNVPEGDGLTCLLRVSSNHCIRLLFYTGF